MLLKSGDKTEVQKLTKHNYLHSNNTHISFLLEMKSWATKIKLCKQLAMFGIVSCILKVFSESNAYTVDNDSDIAFHECFVVHPQK